MSTAQQMNQARKSVRNAMAVRGKDTSHLHSIAMQSLSASGMKECIVNEMGFKAVMDVICKA
jgi:hypothetical protein